MTETSYCNHFHSSHCDHRNTGCKYHCTADHSYMQTVVVYTQFDPQVYRHNLNSLSVHLMLIKDFTVVSLRI